MLIKHIFKDYIFQYLVVQKFCFISKSQHDEIYCDSFCLIAALGITLEKYPTIKNADGKLYLGAVSILLTRKVSYRSDN